MLGALDEAAYIANPEKSDSMTHQSQGQYWAEPERLRDRRLKVRHRRFFLLVAHLGGGRFTRPTAAVQTWRRNWSSCPKPDSETGGLGAPLRVEADLSTQAKVKGRL